MLNRLRPNYSKGGSSTHAGPEYVEKIHNHSEWRQGFCES
jgi:hypothetical protein